MAAAPLVQIQGVEPEKHWVPSRFNARTVAEDGTLILYNSYLGTYSCFPATMRVEVEDQLHRKGFLARPEGLTKYLYERGYLVPYGTDELQRMRHIYGQLQYRQDLLELILLSSEECNFRCVYCYETFPRETMEPWVREAVVKLVEKRAPLLKRLRFAWFGGEPLLGYEAIEDIAPHVTEICEKHGIRFTGDMTTNGYLLTPDRFEKLVRWGMRSYQISLDGSAIDHDSHRILKGGGATHATVLSNLRAMRRTKHEFRVAIRVNFDKETRVRLQEFLADIEEFRNDPRFTLRFYAISKWGGQNDDSLDVCGTNQDVERDYLSEEAAEKGFNVEGRKHVLSGAKTGNAVCYAARPHNFIVGADGRLMKCTIALNEDYNVVGSIGKDGQLAVDIDRLTKWTSPYFEDDAVCKKCFYVPVCQGCSCPLQIIVDKVRPCPPDKQKIHRTLQSLWKTQRETANRYSLKADQLTKAEV